MPARKADVEWQGSLKDGSGTMHLGTGAFAAEVYGRCAGSP